LSVNANGATGIDGSSINVLALSIKNPAIVTEINTMEQSLNKNLRGFDSWSSSFLRLNMHCIIKYNTVVIIAKYKLPILEYIFSFIHNK